MSKNHVLALSAIALLGTGAIFIPPALGGAADSPDPESVANPLPPPIDPPPAAGETQIPATVSPDEDAYVRASPAEQEELLARLRETVDCARAEGVRVPDPVAVDVGALIPWRDGEPDRATSQALENCFEPPE